eukprot:360548_1
MASNPSRRMMYVKQSMDNQLKEKNNTISQLRKQLEEKNDAFVQMSQRLELLQNALRMYEEKLVQSMNKFPTKSIQRLPFQIPGGSQILYSTRYAPENANKCGIFQYDIQTEQHQIIKSWESLNYYPRWNVSIYNQTEHCIIFVGGVDVTNNKQKYNSIMIYDIPTKTMQNIDFKIIIGSNARIVLTHNDKYLHIIGGSANEMHIRYNLLTNESDTIQSFHNTIPCIISHGLLYNPLSNRLIIFGGKVLKTYYDGFWMLDLNDTISSLSNDVRSQYLVSGYMGQLINNTDYNKRNNDMFFTNIVMFLGNDISVWKRYSAKRMHRKMGQFGYVLYNNRIIITFGGRTENGSVDNIYYIDTFDDNSSWKESAITIPKRGSYNAVLIDNKTVHILPFYEHSDHFYVDITNILPPELLIVDKCPQCDDLNLKIKALQNQLTQNKVKAEKESLNKMKVTFNPIITTPKQTQIERIQNNAELEIKCILYDKTHLIIKKCNDSSTYLKKMSTFNDKSLIELNANDDEKKENETIRVSVKLFDKYSEYYSIIRLQSSSLSETNTENHLLELTNHQNKLSKLLTECEVKSLSGHHEYDSHLKQYRNSKQQRVELQNKITAEFKECNKLIEKENKLFQQLQNVVNTNNEMDQKVESLKSSSNECKLILGLYNNFMTDNKKYINKINKTFQKLWDEFESQWMEWLSKDVIIWFKYKTIKMNTMEINWEKIEKQLNIRKITGKSLQKFNDLIFQLIGVQEFDIIKHLISEISRLRNTYPTDNSDNLQVNVKQKNIPKEFICPITKEIMQDPVIAFDGYSYDRIAIEQYLKTHKKSPTTGANADYIIVFPNHKLKASIKQYIRQNNNNLEIANGNEGLSEGENETVLL